MAAALDSRANWALQAIQERLEKIREKTEVIYTLDTLEYLARGGRIGRVKAMAGALLNLKPVIRVDTDGKYSTVTTGRTLGKSINCDCRIISSTSMPIHLSGSPCCMVVSPKKRKC